MKKKTRNLNILYIVFEKLLKKFKNYYLILDTNISYIKLN